MMPEVSFALAFTAGLLSFLSPCFLPLVPTYLTYLSSSSSKENVSLVKTLAFVTGFSLVFISLGASASLIGQFLLQYQSLLRKISGLVIIIFAFHLMGIFEIKSFYREKRWLNPTSRLSSFFLGVAFSFGWTPCIGPVLSSVLLAAGTAKTVGLGVALLATYSLGLALPFILAAVFWQQFLSLLPKSSKYSWFFSKASGVLLLILGIMVFTNFFPRLNSLFPYFSPNF